jgi:ABC-type antimicrobial peptide transport system permease subunit
VRQRRLENDAPDPVAYVPYAANPIPGFTILARSTADTAMVVSTLRDAVRGIDADIPLHQVGTVDAALARQRWPLRIFGAMFAIFAGVALLLAIVGLYAVTAYSISQRRHEIGVRMALGAHSRQIRWLVTRRGTAQLGVGVVVGIGGALAVSRVLPSMLVGTGRADPITLVTVAALLAGVGVAACLVPAARATRIDPMLALRAE